MPLEQPPESAEPPLIVVLGPTSSGKTGLAIALAQRLNGEVVGADSRQVYRDMDIGTGKVTASERGGVAHHLIDVVDPDEPFGLADYVERASAALVDIRARGRTPILAGGSGQYIWAMAEGWEVPRVAPDLELRAALAERARARGPLSLHEELAQIDPSAAHAIHPQNVRRVIRALEIAATTSQAPSLLRARRSPPPSVLLLGLRVPRSELYARIDRRVDDMVRRGLVAEAEGLLKRGYARSLPSMSGIGYTQVVQFLHGELSLPEAVERTKAATHRFARQQAAWFRANDERIAWLSAEPVEAAVEHIHRRSGLASELSPKGEDA